MTTAPGSPRERRLQYVVIPHPDDEFGAWALVADRPDSYPVFLLCTHGEATGMGDGRGYQGELGEWLPQPQPWAGPHTPTLRAQRLHSWHAFLDAMPPTGSIDESSYKTSDFEDGPSAFQLRVGAHSARVVFDGGDGRLTPEFVTAAIARTRDLRLTHLPFEQEDSVVGAAYYNNSYDAVRYAHPDHRAIHVALWETDQGVPGPQWCRTASTDPDVAATGGRVRAMTRDTYRTAMAIDPTTGRRTGVVQAAYGWLAPGDGWAQGETDATAIFSRRQSFWRRFG